VREDETVELIKQLPLKWRGLAYLLWVEGYTQAGAARKLGTGRSNVCHKLHRMEKYLRRRGHGETRES
jgi:DNA-directed RNA polymerase specialized sigma24 family protein